MYPNVRMISDLSNVHQTLHKIIITNRCPTLFFHKQVHE